MSQPNVLLRMDQCIRNWETSADEKTLFLSCYRLMTENMLQALERGEFQNKSWTDHLLHHFAGYYFQALDIYEKQAPGLPAVWRYAFDAANQTNQAPIQKLLLGINAHINYDLVLTLHDLLREERSIPLNQFEKSPFYADYCYVNEIIGRTIDSVQDQILEPAQPSMRLVDDLMGRVDEWLLGHLITHWRDQVWKNTKLLLAASPGTEKDQVVQAVETRALERAEAIMGKNWPLGIRKIV